MKDISRKLIKKKLVDYFKTHDLKNISYQLNDESSKEYLIFSFGAGNNVEYSDNKVLLKEKLFYVMYYTLNPDLIDERIIQIQEALSDYTCIDDGTDVPYKNNTKLRGVRMTFVGDFLDE